MRSILAVVAAVALTLVFFFVGQVPAGNPDAGEALAGGCASCHGRDGIAAVDRYPSLAGQNEGYLYEAMKAYQNGNRRGGQATVMHGQVSGLSEQELRDLAAYYAAMPRTGAKED
mgnify:CR=1 FL=1